MRKIVLIIIFIFGITSINAQTRDKVIYKQSWDKQTIFWGFYLGANKKDYKISYLNENTFITSEPSVGFNVGLIGDLRLHKNINLRLEPGLSSNTKTLHFRNPNLMSPQDSIREVSATYLRVPLLLKLSTNRLYNIRPYIIGGVSYDYNFSSNEDNPDDNETGGSLDSFRMKKNNFTYEIGAGIDIYLPYFIFSPSIRGVFAINNELVKDLSSTSPYTGNVDYFGTRGIFIKLAFH